jgi:ribonuclease HI
MKNSAKEVIIYTDGGCWPNPGIGGWGATMKMPDGNVVELTGGEKVSTNNRMELMGPIVALEYFTTPMRIKLYSDSQYVVKGINEWIHNWRRKGWKTANKKPVLHQDLWERLDAARNVHKVTFEWVPGHEGIEGNERADELSKVGAMETCGHVIHFDQFIYK